jgi:hypothetical protein
MSTFKITHISETDKIVSQRLLDTFKTIFSSTNFSHLKDILHNEGVFFGKMNRDKACGYFYNLFFNEGGTSEKFHIQFLRGITLDRYAGENVLEIRCSEFDPFTFDYAVINKKFGDELDLTINESIFRFAFSFKDDQIYTIRIPGKCTADLKNLIKNN